MEPTVQNHFDLGNSSLIKMLIFFLVKQELDSKWGKVASFQIEPAFEIRLKEDKELEYNKFLIVFRPYCFLLIGCFIKLLLLFMHNNEHWLNILI